MNAITQFEEELDLSKEASYSFRSAEEVEIPLQKKPSYHFIGGRKNTVDNNFEVWNAIGGFWREPK